MLQPLIEDLEVLDNYILRLTYNTGEIKRFDVSPYISGDWYGKLKNVDYFRTVHIIDSGKGIAWEDGQDIAPHELYDLGVPEQ